ncbi:TPA: glycosyltransferase [Klebsiella pneumoniae]|nr:glycosyltransferase [Klebsiella pneumoniae]
MKLSIIIPCYNCAERINKLLMQIYPQVEDNDNVEVILVNDGSKWNSSCLFVYKLGQPTDLTYLPSQRKTAHSII